MWLLGQSGCLQLHLGDAWVMAQAMRLLGSLKMPQLQAITYQPGRSVGRHTATAAIIVRTKAGLPCPREYSLQCSVPRVRVDTLRPASTDQPASCSSASPRTHTEEGPHVPSLGSDQSGPVDGLCLNIQSGRLKQLRAIDLRGAELGANLQLVRQWPNKAALPP